MIRTKAAAELDGWIEQAETSLIAPLARGVSKNAAAVLADPMKTAYPPDMPLPS